MKDIICRCGHKMAKVGSKSDSSFGKSTNRVEYTCPYCGNVAFLDPEKRNLQ